MPSEYEKLHSTYRAMAKAALGGDKQAHADKAKVMNEIRAVERDAARSGTILSAAYAGDRVVTKAKDAPSKRSLQEEYVRKFDGEKLVKLDGKEQTLRDYHTKRLLKK